jgi:hypothetical protein
MFQKKQKKHMKKYPYRRKVCMSELFSRFLKVWMSPLSGCLEKIMDKFARYNECGKVCNLVYFRVKK